MSDRDDAMDAQDAIRSDRAPGAERGDIYIDCDEDPRVVGYDMDRPPFPGVSGQACGYRCDEHGHFCAREMPCPMHDGDPDSRSCDTCAAISIGEDHDPATNQQQAAKAGR